MNYWQNIWSVLNELSFWLLLGCFISGIMHVIVPAYWFKKHLGKNSFLSVFKAVFIGIPMPLCSCGVIPAALALKKQGAGNGASMGFMISTPQVGVDSILVTSSLLSWPFTLLKVLAAFILGMIGGMVSAKLDESEENATTCEIPENILPRPKTKLVGIYDFAINELLYTIWLWIIVGVLISAAITTWLPADLVKDWTSYSLFLTFIIVLAVSLPLYVCATSSVPIAAALVEAGMPLSACVVFLMAGPATNFATIGTVYKIFGKKHLANYLITIILGSIFVAFIAESVLPKDIIASHKHHNHSISYSVYILLFFFALFTYRKIKTILKRNAVDSHAQTTQFQVSGLNCQNCVNKITQRLNTIPTLKVISVNLQTGIVTVTVSNDKTAEIPPAVTQIGFKFQDFLK